MKHFLDQFGSYVELKCINVFDDRFSELAESVRKKSGDEADKCEEGEEEELEEEMFDKEAELGQDMSRYFHVTETESVEVDDGVRGFGEVTTKTEVVDYRMCGGGEKEWMTIIDEAVSF